MGYLKSEQEAEMIIEEMKRKNKGKYITQGVSFNKDSERQMELLKYVLMYSSSFSGMIKELLADKISANEVKKVVKYEENEHIVKQELSPTVSENKSNGSTGNFLL